MLTWLRNRLRERNASPLTKWRVDFANDCIVTCDGSGTSHKLPIADLHKVIVQTDDSGPWGADVLFFLFAKQSEPAGVFPIEAQGSQEFVHWLSNLPGYRDRELARAMASTDIAEFLIYHREA